MVIKLPRSRESTPVAVTPPSTTLATIDNNYLNNPLVSYPEAALYPSLILHSIQSRC